MITTNTRHKIKVYTTPAYVEHFRLYLENKVVIKNNNLCFFCTQYIKESSILPFPLVKFLNNDLDYLVRLADSMGEEFSRNEFIPPYISACKNCNILVKDPDRFFATYQPKTGRKQKAEVDPIFKRPWLVFVSIFTFYTALIFLAENS
tara:strand:+ start:79 stop:522 length:444 start_codon:yes stop_codon:yes gene_type:complete